MTKHRGHKGSMDGVLFDGHLIQEVEHGRAARVTTPDGAVYVLTDQHDVPADVFPAHVTALVQSIVRSACGGKTMTTTTASRFSRSVTAEYHRRYGLFPHEAAGLRHLFRPRGRKNALVGIYDGEPAGFDTDGGRWQTVCEVHGSILSHETLALARDWARDPWSWCEGCQAHHEEA